MIRFDKLFEILSGKYPAFLEGAGVTRFHDFAEALGVDTDAGELFPGGLNCLPDKPPWFA